MTENKIRVIVAMHKSYPVPSDEMYFPLHVGAAVEPKQRIVNASTIQLKEDRVTAEAVPGDDTGDNISLKNPNFCELTGLYWAWKNITDADAIGLVHYRRHFILAGRAFRSKNGAFRSALTGTQARELFTHADIIVPKKRNYYIETLYSHYDHTLDGMHLDMAREIIEERYPDYLPFLDRVYNEKSGYMFNMMILKRHDLDEYCSFLFDVLFEMEEKLSASGYLKKLDTFEARLFGRVSEILFNAWVEKKRKEGYRVREVAHFNTENVNWLRKGSSFLAAKFLHKKYHGSF